MAGGKSFANTVVPSYDIEGRLPAGFIFLGTHRDLRM